MESLGNKGGRTVLLEGKSTPPLRLSLIADLYIGGFQLHIHKRKSTNARNRD